MAIAVDEIAQILGALGCPADRCGEMAIQLDKRACQLAEAKGRTHEEAVAHLLKLMSHGWAASNGSPGGD